MTTKPPTDPMKSFAGVAAAALLLEVLVVLLAIPVVANLGSGLATWQGVLIGALALALLVTCAFLRRPWGLWLAAALQLVLVACWLAHPVLGVLGLIFGLVWTVLLWMRQDVARRQQQGTLPAQKSTED